MASKLICRVQMCHRKSETIWIDWSNIRIDITRQLNPRMITLQHISRILTSYSHLLSHLILSQ